ncbi:MAG: DUF3810 domain-containing protein [Blastocatellia bacterium]|nr:DUF3810 domain-containing protein [Blastocatellia bacterium]
MKWSVFQQAVKRHQFGLAVGFPWLCALVLCFGVGSRPDLVESWYSRTCYPRIAQVLALASRWFSFSLAETALIFGALGLLGWLARMVWHIRKKQMSPSHALRRATIWVLLGVGWMWLIFQVLWGLNYSRMPLGAQLGLPHQEPTSEELVALSQNLIEDINRTSTLLRTSGETEKPLQMSMDREALGRQLAADFGRATWIAGNHRGKLALPKAVRFSDTMARLGISGIYAPFTGEANYNGLLPDCELPFTMAHEMAHQHGYASEDEANFVAFLVCSTSASAECRYSAFLLANQYVLFSLALTGTDITSLVTQLAPGPKADLKAIRDFWLHYRGWLQKVANRVNDTYLKANGVQQGVASYGEMVMLLADFYRKKPT